ncbi:hypothetical protein VHEMI08035 [[Torrubiella] hemipterigena]|uniref:Uncharacterized protein n=1 Tax=[Torrubiella] hemipterigena TaxID=1531966 RepID=A0A0A1TMG0_9HYPO|nr:hypothetical protein VHEMI08035 [[Torrubiella] hemipterigena]
MSSFDLELLLNGKGRDASTHMRKVLKESGNVQVLTKTLVDAVDDGSIPPAVYPMWMTITNSTHVTVYGMKQTSSRLIREHAIRAFVKRMRHADTMEEMWETVGQEEGLAALMNSFAVVDVKNLCSGLGGCAFATSGLEQRQRLLSSLLNLLHPLSGNTPPTDTRPLLPIYVRLLPACSSQLVKEWAVKFELEKWFMSYDVTSRLVQAHSTTMEHFVITVQNPEKWNLDMIKVLLKTRYQFCLDLLKRFIDMQKTMTTRYIFIYITETISAQCTKQRLPWEFQTQFWTLLCDCLAKHENLRAYHSFQCPSWEKADVAYFDEQLLQRLFQVTKDPRGRRNIFRPFSVMCNSAPCLRERIFISYWKHVNDPPIDFPDILGKLERGETVVKLTSLSWYDNDCLKLLPREAFGRVVKAWNAITTHDIENEVVEISVSACSPPYNKDFEQEEVDRCSAFKNTCAYYWSLRASATDNLFPTARNDLLMELDHWKRKAARGRLPADRAYWALQALQIPVLLADLSLFNDTLIWARRFSKDKDAVEIIYNQQVFNDDLMIDLMSGASFLRRNVGLLSKDGLSAHIKNSHTIFHTLTQSYIGVVREPNVYEYDCKIFGSIGYYICRRLQAMDAVQRHLQLSDDDMFSLVWQPTIDTLIACEKACLDSCDDENSMEHIFNWLDHLMSRFYAYSSTPGKRKVKIHSQVTLTFIDKLSRERDHLRLEHRKKKFPDVEKWPAACRPVLPLKHLLPYQVEFRGELPYINSRLTDVLLMDPEEAYLEVTTDGKDRYQQLFNLVHWHKVLRMYLKGTTKDVRRKRINQVWSHVVTHLSEEGRGLVQTGHDWYSHFKEAGVRSKEITCHPDVVMPSAKLTLPLKADTEWDPNASIRFQLAGTGRETYIDCYTSNTKFDYGPNIDAIRQKDTPESFWAFMEALPHRRLVANGGDALIEAAILSLESYQPEVPSILEKAMPGNINVRYPLRKLSADFTNKHVDDSPKVSLAMHVLWELRDRVPSIVVARLAESILDVVIAHENPLPAAPYELIVRMIDMLFRGDKPSLALPLISTFIDQLNNESTWHPGILNVGLFNRLEPKLANEYLFKVSNLVLSRLEKANAEISGEVDKSDVKDDVDEDAETETDAEAEEDPEAKAKAKEASRSIVKTTTTRLVPEIIRNGLFTDGSPLFDLTTKFFSATKNISVKTAILESLLVKLDTSPDNWQPYAELIKEHFIQVAGSLNEDFPETEGTWRVAETGGKLPKPYDASQGSPKLLTSLFKLLHRRNEALVKLFMSAIQLSIQNNKRWAQLFLKKIGVEVELHELPDSPVYPDILLDLVEGHCEYVPKQILDILIKGKRAKMNPSPKMRHVAKLVEAITGQDTELVDQKRHYISSFVTWYCESSKPLDRPDYFHVTELGWRSKTICHLYEDRYTIWVIQQLTGYKPSNPDISESDIDDMALDFASACCRNGRKLTLEFLGLILTPSSAIDGPLKPESRFMPLVNKLKTLTESMRTEAWAKDKLRSPLQLASPEHFEIFRLGARRFKTLALGVDLETNIAFGQDIIALLRRIHSNRFDVQHLVDFVKERIFNHPLREPYDWIIEMGRLDKLDNAEEPTVVDLCRISCVLRIMDGNSNGDDSLDSTMRHNKEFVAMLYGWATSPVEELRLNAYRAVGEQLYEQLVEKGHLDV